MYRNEILQKYAFESSRRDLHNARLRGAGERAREGWNTQLSLNNSSATHGEGRQKKRCYNAVAFEMLSPSGVRKRLGGPVVHLAVAEVMDV